MPESSFTHMEQAMEAVYNKKNKEEEASSRVVVTPEKLEQWLRDSIGEVHWNFMFFSHQESNLIVNLS